VLCRRCSFVAERRGLGHRDGKGKGGDSLCDTAIGYWIDDLAPTASHLLFGVLEDAMLKRSVMRLADGCVMACFYCCALAVALVLDMIVRIS